MKKSLIVAAASIVVLILAFASAYSQEDMEEVSNWVFDRPQRPSAVFFHDAHNEAAELDDCAECHHVYDENGEKLEYASSEDQACYECHDDKDDGSKPGLMKAYHMNCKGCHMEQRKGPILCAQCHVRS